MADERIHVHSPSKARWDDLPLTEAREIVRALHDGEVDAFVVAHRDADRVFFLEDPDAARRQRELRATRDALEQTQVEYQTLFQLAGAGMVQVDLTTARFLRANRRMCQITGYTEAELQERTILDITHPDDRARSAESVAGLAAGTIEEHVSQKRYICKGGSVRWVTVNAVGLRDERGIAQRAVAIVQDITDRRQAGIELARTLERLRLAQAAAESGIWDVDCRSGEIVWTDEYRMLYGHGPEAAPSYDNWLASVHPEDRARVEQELQHCMMERSPRCVLEFRCIHPQRGLRWLRSISRIVYEGDAPVRMTGLTQDVSESRRLEEELRRSNEELQQFASVVAHDLRSPLLSINGCVELLEQAGEALNDENRQLLGYMRQSVAGMSQLIMSLLTFTRLGFSQINCSACDMEMVLARARHHVHSHVAEAGARILVEPLPAVSGDGTMLAQLFQNLLENAIKYRSQQPPTIQVGARREGGMCTFWVRDNGLGIEASQLEHIFQPFHRVGGQQGTERGIGLGLATCRQIVERHGGKIWAESKAGEGTTFFFTLPAAVA